jgi:hypothetical protein
MYPPSMSPLTVYPQYGATGAYKSRNLFFDCFEIQQPTSRYTYLYNMRKGHKISEGTKAKIRRALLGVPKSIHHREMISQGMKRHWEKVRYALQMEGYYKRREVLRRYRAKKKLQKLRVNSNRG